MLFFFFFFFLSAVTAQTCPPGFWGPSCQNQCSGCATGVSNGVTYQRCVDQVDGNGDCVACSNPSTQYGPHCTNCLVALEQTNVLMIAGHLISETLVPVDYCSNVYPGTVCGNSMTQTDICQCPGNKVFAPIFPTEQYIIPISFPPHYIAPTINQYCCLPSCPSGKYGCQCDRTCGSTGCFCELYPPLSACTTCTQTEICGTCGVDYYAVYQGPLLTFTNGSLLQNITDSNRVCKPCAEGCRICSPETNSNCTSSQACSDLTGNCLNQCLPGWFGPRCDKQCNCPIVGSICDEGVSGSGNCSCADSNKVLSNLYQLCIIPSCGVDRINLCSNQGLCVESFDGTGYSELCYCNTGWNGTICNETYVGYNECDCGVLWNNPYQASPSAVPGIILLQDMQPGISLLGNGIVPVGSAEQAKWLCSQDFFCDLFLLWSSPLYGRITNQQETFPTPVLIAGFAQLSPSSHSLPSALPVGVTFQVYTIDRIRYNNCSSASLDIDFYFYNNATNRQVIKQYSIDQGTTASHEPGTDSYNKLFPSYEYWVYRHWRYAGHLARLNPNTHCLMQPVVFDPASYCSKSRCLSLSGIGPPCVYQGQVTGYCMPNDQNPTGYQCSCLQFFEADDQLTGTLNYQPFYRGQACQFPVVAFCELNSFLLCNGVVGACQEKREWNGTFFLENFQQFEQTLYQDYIPYCNCEGSPYTGQYCEQFRCLNDCHSQQAHGTCVFGANSTYVCACNDGWLGTDCSIDASVCLHDNVNCAGRGTCLLDISNNPYCSCNEGFLNSQCQDFYCDASLMTPGHGTCINNVPQGCYSPYVGPACSIDSCARYGGVVIGNPPSGCNCSLPYANLLNNKVVPACWPQCPKLNNATCGVPGAGACIQTETTPDFTRTAICQCNTGFIYNITTGLCDSFCLNGNVPVGWTQQNLLPCVCDPSTGFDINNGLNPRCDNPVCNKLGTWTGSHCDCIPPFQNFTNCATNTCNRGGSVIPWGNGASLYRCSCPLPYAPLIATSPYDCSGTVCGAGQPNPSFTDPKNACFCQGKFRTICNATACEYCAGSFCINSGYPNPANINLCSCPFPFSGDNCEVSQCVNGLASATIFACICSPGWTGKLCSQPACVNGQLVNNTCVCSTSYTGQMCDSLLQNIATIDPLTQIVTPAGTAIVVPGPQPALTKTQATAVLATSALIAAGSVGMIIFLFYTQFKSLVLAKAAVHEMAPLVSRAA